MNLLTVKQVATKLSCADSMVWRLTKQDPAFPQPIKIGLGEKSARATRWVEESLDVWLTRKQIQTLKEIIDDNGRTDTDIHQGAGEKVPA